MGKEQSPSSTDYKSTLFLPQTDFPMRANLAQREPSFLQAWDESGVYERLMADRSDKPLFILHDGPPYANANIHIGTALNKILKDFITISPGGEERKNTLFLSLCLCCKRFGGVTLSVCVFLLYNQCF